MLAIQKANTPLILPWKFQLAKNVLIYRYKFFQLNWLFLVKMKLLRNLISTYWTTVSLEFHHKFLLLSKLIYMDFLNKNSWSCFSKKKNLVHIDYFNFLKQHYLLFYKILYLHLNLFIVIYIQDKTQVQYLRYCSLCFPLKIQPCDYLTKKYTSIP